MVAAVTARRRAARFVLRIKRPGRVGCLSLLMAAYFILAFAAFLRFHEEKWYSISGDEPHYLVTTSGIIHDHTLVQTLPYEQEFASDAIARPSRLGLPGQPVTERDHVVDGPHGQYPFHGIGLSVALIPGFWLRGVTGAQLEMVLLTGASVAAATWAALRRLRSAPAACAVAVAVAFGVPLLLPAAQIYPDIPAGAMSLLVAVAFTLRKRRRPLAFDIGLSLILAAQPWFNVKYGLPAVIGAVALGWQHWVNGDRRRLAILAAIVVGSLLLLAGYNEYALGHVFGPYGREFADGPDADATAVMVTFGLQIDRFQGIFAEQPMLLLGLLWSIRCAFRRQGWAILCLLLYLSLLIPNGLEPQTYGGGSFAGRFSSSAGLVLFLPTVLALVRLWETRRALWAVIVVGGITLQAIFFVEYMTHRFHLQNVAPNTWLEFYPSLWGPLARLLPALYARSWAFGYLPNLFAATALIVAILMAAVGVRRLLAAAFVVALVGYGAAAVTAGSPAPDQPFLASQLSSQTGRVVGTSREAVATDRNGYLTSGPSGLRLPAGTYTFELDYWAVGSGEPIGTWTVSVANKVTEIRQGTLLSTGGVTRALYVTFTVPAEGSTSGIQFQTHFDGHGSLGVDRIVLIKGSRSGSAVNTAAEGRA